MDILNTARFLKGCENVLILTHQSPDGDTLGSGFALCYALRQLGKNANVVCSDPIPDRYSYFTSEYTAKEFEVKTVIAVDVADTVLLGKYKDTTVDFCIDHHPSNRLYAKETCLSPESASTTELLTDIFLALGVEFTPLICDCLYTGLTTDTGCFRYTNTTSHTHLAASALITNGADAGKINRIMFETKSRARVAVEKDVYQNMEFFEDGKIAVVYVTQELLKRTGASEEELEGVSALPRQIEGVKVGFTLREKEDGSFKISVRTCEEVDASEICASFGGGGHARAAGCSIKFSLNDTKNALIEEAKKYI